MRISTGSIMQRYNRNLSKAIGNLDSSRIKVLTNRNFNTIAEDPAAAAKSFKLRREYNQTADHVKNIEDTISLFDNLAAGALDVSTMLTQDVNEDVLRAVNGATGAEAREAYAKSLRGVQETIVLSLNAKYGDRYLYGGASTKEAPFAFDPETNKLTYRGLDVNDPANQAQLEQMMGETLYVDLGFGLNEDAGQTLLPNTAFNTAASGLSILGFGQHADGASKNVVVLLGQMADELEKDPLDLEKFNGLLDHFNVSKNDAADYVSELGTRSQFLEDTKKILTDQQDTLNEQIIDVEDVDMAAAISEYVWQQYAYNAALKVGTSILSPSFIDFMS